MVVVVVVVMVVVAAEAAVVALARGGSILAAPVGLVHSGVGVMMPATAAVAIGACIHQIPFLHQTVVAALAAAVVG
jgi:hypothetical protein